MVVSFPLTIDLETFKLHLALTTTMATIVNDQPQNPKFLDELIVREANLNKIKTPQDFLKEIGEPRVQAHYIGLAAERMDLSRIPVGFFYVVTPETGIQLKRDLVEKSGLPKIADYDMKGQEFERFFVGMRNKAKPSTLRSKFTANVIYFDKSSLEKFTVKMKDSHLRLMEIVDIPVQDYGIVQMHVYTS